MQARRIEMLGAVSIIRPKHIPVDVGPGETLLLDEPIPFPTEDAWGILPDGELLIARVGANQVERVGADGTVIVADLPYAATSITQADRRWYMEFWAEQIRAEGLGINVASIIDRHSANVTWPDKKPPFVGRLTFVDNKGRMWLRQTVQDGRDTPTYDLIDRAGVYVHRVVFPGRTHLLGFGSGVVFVARTDDVGLQWLERYRFE